MASEVTVYIVDDDASARDSLSWLMESVGLRSQSYDSARSFLDDMGNVTPGCLLLDVRLQDMSGIELHRALKQRGFPLPVIFITGHGDLAQAVQAMKDGAVDFVTKPIDDQRLLDAVRAAVAQGRTSHARAARLERVADRMARLSRREREVLDKVIEGKLNKTIADELRISPKTVEAHRARVMEKMQADSLAELVRQITLLELANTEGA